VPDIRYVHPINPSAEERLEMADKMESFLAARAAINTRSCRAAWNDGTFRHQRSPIKAVIASLGQPLPRASL
jgi:hypothetical protein